jgi:signal peptidase I
MNEEDRDQWAWSGESASLPQPATPPPEAGRVEQAITAPLKTPLPKTDAPFATAPLPPKSGPVAPNGTEKPPPPDAQGKRLTTIPGARFTAPDKMSPSAKKSPQRRLLAEPSRLRMVREVLETITLTILMFMVFRFAVQNYRVDGHSMAPTLQDQQYILVDKAAYLFHPPQRGDIIVFAYPVDPTQDYVKRIIGIPGDRVQVDQNGVVSVNGVKLNEPYISASPDPYAPTNMVLRADQYFVLGDNRGDSSDSRVWGPVPRQNIIGKASVVYWPLTALHFIPGESAVFGAVKP